MPAKNQFYGELLKQNVNPEVFFSMFNADTGITAAQLALILGLSTTELAALELLGDLSATEVGYLDGVNPAAQPASKAVIADANRDVNSLRRILLGLNGASGYAGQMTLHDGQNPGASEDLTYALLAQLAANVPAGGSYTCDGDDDTAGTLDIVTGLGTVTSYNVMILRSGVPIFSDQAISESGGTITVADGGATYAITTGDVILWQAIGTLA